ncbi:acetyl-CoA carboxylase carboxyl transferase subunit alpha [Priestia megaterium]|uniref:Acetyl-coenzyme A carboxylase carboxyl transferase subunit alpha n=1 Tax=Priestia megaterium TaxID=1404 RepID=A0A6M6E2G1_PRIMG|nr:acetyl-CoA carboxylase carboxyl transferase subunit alpha [Priestia megaterium]QJX81000.1 acetyl-CoA carboxylase carboxyl transferase subunit alpha [Priestia megaterium]
MTKETNVIEELEQIELKIAELKKFSIEQNIDLSDDISSLQSKFETLQKTAHERITPWERVKFARHIERPTSLDYIRYLFNDFIELHGDRLYGDDEAIVSGIALFQDKPVTVIGHQKGKTTKENLQRNFGMPHPEGYRKALRLMQQANKFNRPIICFINTAGAYPGKEAEERGQSEAIARNLREMAGFTVPIICIVIGEGGSGGALALGVGNHIFMLENTYYSVISPEGAASLLWKDSSKAQTAAETMKITPPDLLELGAIDGIIPEVLGGAQKNIPLQAEYIRNQLKKSLTELSKLGKEELMEHRYEKFRVMGSFI